MGRFRSWALLFLFSYGIVSKVLATIPDLLCCIFVFTHLHCMAGMMGLTLLTAFFAGTLYGRMEKFYSDKSDVMECK